jgi:twitching motility protein PilT
MGGDCIEVTVNVQQRGEARRGGIPRAVAARSGYNDQSRRVMKQIDKLVGHLIRFQAEVLVASSNGPVVVRVGGVERASNQTLDHAAITAMVLEVAPPAQQQELRANRAARFVYDSPQGAIGVEVTPSAASWRLSLSPVTAGRASRGLSSPMVPKAAAPVPSAATVPTPLFRDERMSAPAPVPAAPAAIAPAAAATAGDTASIDRLLKAMTQKGASDLHLSTGMTPIIRLHGEMQPLEGSIPPLTDAMLRQILMPVTPTRNKEEFARRNDTDFAYEIVGVARYRVNLFADRNGIGAVLRRIPFEIVPAEKLGLSPEVMELCNLSKGLVLVTGPTGSGKSTTLAAMVDRVNATRDDHILTIEDPIEFVHNEKRCLINQREVRVHTDGFRPALRAALREDPDVVLVGEMRDLETIEIAIETAETGHLVFGTLHTNTAPSTVDRIIDQFPADRQSQIRIMLSESLRGVISQTLCKKVGGGRVAAYEVLIGTPAVSNLIREAKTFQLYSMMQSGKKEGMVTLGESLTDLVLRGLIDPREAYYKAINKTEIRTLLGNVGINLPE